MLQDIKIGDKIGDEFIVLDIFGCDGTNLNHTKTGFGVVYIVHDKDKRILALKTFQDRYMNDNIEFENFKFESLECVKLKPHPNIVFCSSVEVIKQRPFLVMEPILPNNEGRQSLKDYFNLNLSLEQILDWSIQFCYGMEFINENGIKYHGDIKPENILVNYLNQVKISDFGLLGLYDTQVEDSFKGTYPYMAPETFKGNNNIKTDIYAFGIVLYQLVNNGCLPFYTKSTNFEDWEELHNNSKIPKSKIIDEIIQKCLEKNPKNRFSSFYELRLELEENFSNISSKTLYKPSIIEFDEDLNNLIISHSYAQYNDLDNFKKYSKNIENSNNIGILLEYGIDLIYTGNHRKAITIFNKIIKSNSKSDHKFDKMDRLYFNIGHAYHENNMLFDAKTYYLKCISLNDDYNKAKVNLGNVFREVGDFEKSLHYYDEVLNVQKDFYEAIYNKAILLSKMQRIDEAEQLFNEIQYVKDNKKLFIDKALMYYDTDNIQSLLELSKIDILDEKNADALLLMTIIHISKNKLDLANDNYNLLMNITQDNIHYKLTIASCYFENGHENEFKKIIDNIHLNGSSHDKYEALLLESELIFKKDIKKSDEILNNILKSNASKKQKSRCYVIKFLFNDKNKSNKKYLDNALKLDKYNEKAHLNYIQYYYNKNQLSKTLKKIKIGLLKIPNSQEMYFLKGKVNINQNKIESAIECFEKALTVNKPQVKIYMYLIFCYLRMKNSGKLAYYFNLAVNLDGEFINTKNEEYIVDKLIEKYSPELKNIKISKHIK